MFDKLLSLRRAALAVLVSQLLLVALFGSARAVAAPGAGAPLTVTRGEVRHVASVPALKAALDDANRAKAPATLLLADGAYVLDVPALDILCPGLAIRSASGNRDAVIVRGPDEGPRAAVGSVFLVSANDVVIADLTLGYCRHHGIQVRGESPFDVSGLRVHNCRIVNCNQQFIKGSSSEADPVGATDGCIEQCLFEFTSGWAYQSYTGGIDIHKGVNWIVRDNLFRCIRTTAGQAGIAEHAVHFWKRCPTRPQNIVVERNWIVNCDRGIGFGLGSLDGGHQGGASVIRNNMVFNDGAGPHTDVGIGLEYASGVHVDNNTVVIQNYWAPIEYRFPGSSDLVFRNNLVNRPIQRRDDAPRPQQSNNLEVVERSWFRDLASGDLRLTGAASRAIDAGPALEGFGDDVDGLPRPQGGGWDIGACEFGASAAAISPDRVLVGVNYFAGWWQPLPNKWNYDPAVGDWRTNYPGRVPLLGEYNTQDTMDREIVAAADHGVDFFLILWYYNGPGDSAERETNSRFLNEGLRTFLGSKEAHRLGFAIEYCNHPPYQVKTDRDWEECLRAWLPAFRHPSYQRVGGKLLFKVHSWHNFWRENGENAASCRSRLEALRRTVREAGLGEMLIGAGVAANERIEAGHPATQFFEFTNTYMDLPNRQAQEADEPYEALARFIRESRDQHARDAVPYQPFLGAGFNARPWPDPRARFAFPTREEWMIELQRMLSDFDRIGTLGLPLPGGGRQKAFTIYAWNEFGEGGIVAPTRGEGRMKLEAIRGLSQSQLQEYPRRTRARAALGGQGLDPALNMIREAVDKGEVPGAICLVAHRGAIVRHAAFGSSDPERKTPFRTNTLCWIASITKPVTVAAAMTLVDEGRLSLDDPVEKHLPEFREQKDTNGVHHVITVRHLMTHTSGLVSDPPTRRSGWPIGGALDDAWLKAKLPEIVSSIARSRLLFKPGSQARYSNAALFVLGRIIEVASGKPYAQLARERILDPLGMEDTWYAPPASEAGRVAAICAERQGQRSAIFRFNPDLEISNTAPDGGLFSYPAEIYRFLQMFLDNDGKVLSQKAVREMLKEQSPGWGLGWALEDGCFSHAGSSGTSAFADPKSGVIGILFFQFRDQKDRVSALSADFRRQVRAAFAADTTRDAKEP